MNDTMLTHWAAVWLSVGIKSTAACLFAALLATTVLRHRPAWRSFVWLAIIAGLPWLTLLEWLAPQPALVASVGSVSTDLFGLLFQCQILVTLVLAGLVAHSAVRLRMLERYGTRLPIESLLHDHDKADGGGLVHHIGLYRSGQIATPTSFGIARPVVILPAQVADTVYRQLVRFGLVHELIAILRFDAMWMLLLRVVQCVYFVQPAAWMAAAGYRRAREETCDRWTVRTTGEIGEYERQLLAITGERHRFVPMSLDTPMVAGSLRRTRRRIARLQHDDRPETVPPLAATCGVTLTMWLLALLASVQWDNNVWTLAPAPLVAGSLAAVSAGLTLGVYILAGRGRQPRLTPPVDGLAGRSRQTIAECVCRLAREWEEIQLIARVTARRLEPILWVGIIAAATIGMWLVVGPLNDADSTQMGFSEAGFHDRP